MSNPKEDAIVGQWPGIFRDLCALAVLMMVFAKRGTGGATVDTEIDFAWEVAHRMMMRREK